MKLNRTEMADFLAVAPTTLDAWTRQGCPVESRPGQGKAAEFDSGAVTRWWIASQVEKATKRGDADAIDAHRSRKLSAEADLRELELAKLQGELIHLDDVERAFTQYSVAVRGAAMALPDRAALRLAGETDTGVIRKYLRDELTGALREGYDAYHAAMDLPAAEEVGA
ncbi:hypothetical protein [Parasphingorhabdus sp.]|uniref:hypothetical protein n=1 Tax=Parasphingorhabdus sp. TaxID=2709688 RepID=UPI003A911ACA